MVDVTTLELTATDHGVSFEVHAKPRASRSRVVGVREGALDVALAAPPVDGAANAELVATLARVLSVPRRAVTIARGESSRSKRVVVAGVAAEQVRARLARA